ncbi:MAG: hypothetical protein GQF41_1937 [Candidatus Rifleibacterium amylolyticum]|nr:MAG: hypothetical protein GQF41_1937 [Candidatus Rifleibacterium amylolyticum]
MVSTAAVQNIRFDNADPNEPRSVNLYFDHYRGEPIYRAVAYLNNAGCEWSIKTGGCTMCGTKNSRLSRKIEDREFFAQFAVIRKHVEKFNAALDSPIKSLHVYNDGFFFNDNEISPEAREAIFAMAVELGMQKLVVETNGLDIVKDNKATDYLGRAVKRLGDTELEITLGIETTNPLVRSLYNKPDRVEDVRNSLDIIRDKGAIAKGYVLIKGPLLTESEAYQDCIDTIRTLKEWSNGKRFRVEFQPVCHLPNTLHEYLMTLDKSDPYFWEPPLLSTLLRILANFPDMGEDLYTALFARIDADSPWDFWVNRPHDDPETTYSLYLKLVEHYLYRRHDSITSALQIAREELWKKRCEQRIEQSLEERVQLVKKLLELSLKNRMHLSDYLKANLDRRLDFWSGCQKHLASL